VQRIGYQLECHRTTGHGWRLIHQLLAAGVLDPELAQVGAMPSTAPSKSLFRSPLPASYIENLMEEEPLFRTKTGNEDMDELTLS